MVKLRVATYTKVIPMWVRGNYLSGLRNKKERKKEILAQRINGWVQGFPSDIPTLKRKIYNSQL